MTRNEVQGINAKESHSLKEEDKLGELPNQDEEKCAQRYED